MSNITEKANQSEASSTIVTSVDYSNLIVTDSASSGPNTNKPITRITFHTSDKQNELVTELTPTELDSFIKELQEIRQQ